MVGQVVGTPPPTPLGGLRSVPRKPLTTHYFLVKQRLSENWKSLFEAQNLTFQEMGRLPTFSEHLLRYPGKT